MEKEFRKQGLPTPPQSPVGGTICFEYKTFSLSNFPRPTSGLPPFPPSPSSRIEIYYLSICILSCVLFTITIHHDFFQRRVVGFVQKQNSLKDSEISWLHTIHELPVQRPCKATRSQTKMCFLIFADDRRGRLWQVSAHIKKAKYCLGEPTRNPVKNTDNSSTLSEIDLSSTTLVSLMDIYVHILMHTAQYVTHQDDAM